MRVKIMENKRGKNMKELKPNTLWLVIKHVHYESSSFTDDYSVPKATKNKGQADQYLHSLNMLNESKSTSYFLVSVPNE
jgi:hypothetical protein